MEKDRKQYYIYGKRGRKPKVRFSGPILAREMQNISKYLWKIIFVVAFWTVFRVVLPRFYLDRQVCSGGVLRERFSLGLFFKSTEWQRGRYGAGLRCDVGHCHWLDRREREKALGRFWVSVWWRIVRLNFVVGTRGVLWDGKEGAWVFEIGYGLISILRLICIA